MPGVGGRYWLFARSARPFPLSSLILTLLLLGGLSSLLANVIGLSGGVSRPLQASCWALSGGRAASSISFSCLMRVSRRRLQLSLVTSQPSLLRSQFGREMFKQLRKVSKKKERIFVVPPKAMKQLGVAHQT